MRWTGHVVHVAENKNAYRVLVGKLEGKRPFEKDGRIILKLT
jgi:hypothetical protein